MKGRDAAAALNLTDGQRLAQRQGAVAGDHVCLRARPDLRPVVRGAEADHRGGAAFGQAGYSDARLLFQEDGRIPHAKTAIAQARDGAGHRHQASLGGFADLARLDHLRL